MDSIIITTTTKQIKKQKSQQRRRDTPLLAAVIILIHFIVCWLMVVVPGRAPGSRKGTLSCPKGRSVLTRGLPPCCYHQSALAIPLLLSRKLETSPNASSRRFAFSICPSQTQLRGAGNDQLFQASAQSWRRLALL